MKKKSLISVAFSISLLLFLAIATIVVSPPVVLAEDTSNTALELLDMGIELQEQGDLEEAASSYQKAIDSIEASESLENFVLAKSGLIETRFLAKKITKTEANRLLEQIRTGYASLKDMDIPECGECQKEDGDDGYCVKRNGEGNCPERYCKRCSL